MIRSGMPLAATARSLPLLQEASNSPGMINVTARQTGYRLNISPPLPLPTANASLDSRRLSPRPAAVTVLTATAATAKLKSQPRIIDNEESAVGSLTGRAVHGEGATSTMLKNLMFYTVVGSLIALVLQAVGASLGVVLLASLIGPPVLLLAIRIIRA